MSLRRVSSQMFVNREVVTVSCGAPILTSQRPTLPLGGSSVSMSDTILGYGERVGYTYAHIKEIHQEPTTGLIYVEPLCRHGVKGYTYMPKDLNFVRQWHLNTRSLATAVSQLSEKCVYTPCPRCLAKANRLIDRETRLTNE